jgi:hypothetical protein
VRDLLTGESSPAALSDLQLLALSSSSQSTTRGATERRANAEVMFLIEKPF